MTNKEWLDYLAHNAPDELAAWFDAEHVENQELALDGDTEPENEDSREQLEADVRNFAEKSGWLYPMAGTRIVLEWLDRQAAITERECLVKSVQGADAMLAAECAELQAKVDELTAERDKLQEQLLIGWECECRLQAERDELQAQVDELKAERVKLRSQICKLEDDLVRASDERDNWKANCEDWKKHAMAIENAYNEASRWRDEYRSKFGKCLDYADAIHALMDDEGMA